MTRLKKRFRAPRIHRRLPVHLIDDRWAVTQGFTENLSALGCCLSTEQPFPIGTRFQLTVTLPDGVHAATWGVVCWSRSVPGRTGAAARSGVWLTAADDAFTGYVRRELAQCPAAPKPEVRPSSRSVLVVEDDADLRFTMADMLSERGYQVRTAVNGRDALLAIGQGSSPAVIVLDLAMPVMDGRQFLATLREQSSGAAPPVILVSAADRAIPAASHWVRKPVDFELLLARIQECCSERVAG